VRAPDRAIPIELEAICVRATALDPNDRYPDVRAMVDDLDRFLDGDRDLERRRQHAEEHANTADRAASKLLLGQGDVHALRGEIIREVNRALAFDPTHARALQTMLRLLVEPPSDAPPEAEAELKSLKQREQRLLLRNGARAYLAWLLAIPFVVAMGVREPAPLLVFVVLTASVAGGAFWLSTRDEPRPLEGLLIYFVSMLALTLGTSLFGPFLVIPTLMAVNTMLVAHSSERGPWRYAVISLGATFAALPYALERVGLLPRSMEFARDHLTIFPRGVTFTPLPTQIFLAGITVLLVMVPAFFHARVADDATAAQRRMVLHLWQLRQFMPDEARGATTSTLPPVADPILCMIRDTSDALHRSPWLRGHAIGRSRRRGEGALVGEPERGRHADQTRALP
jgi:serine/threonine-protein kinase